MVSARGKRRQSSRHWLDRQLNDPYVKAAQKEGLRSRAAFKLRQLDDRFDLLAPGRRVVDLGAAPGGWTQYMVNAGCKVVALDINEMEPVTGAEIVTLDFLDPAAPDRLKDLLGGPADLVVSDMAPPATGHPKTDHLRIVALVEEAYHFATEILAPGGGFVAKVFQGGAEQQLLAEMKRRFTKTRHAKPPASRAGSSEMFVVATGFKGDV